MHRGWFWCVVVALTATFTEERELRGFRQYPTPTVQDLSIAVNVAADFVSKLQRLEENLAVSGIEVQKNSPSHGQLIDSYPSEHSLTLGKYAFIADRASLYLLQKHCQQSNIPKSVCMESMTRWNMSNTALEDKCRAHFGSLKCVGSYPYRSYDGSCNNLAHPSWGMSSTAYGRLLPAQYADGISQPRRSVSRKTLPSSRLLSSILIPDLDKPDKERTLALVQWTQFLGDDLFHTPFSKMFNVDKAIECCRRDGRALLPRYVHPACRAISIPVDDPDYAPHRTVCMNYVRSLTSMRNDCTFGPADQMNQNTHFLDGSMIYGSNAVKTNALRAMRGGRLLTDNLDGNEFLPESENDCQGNWICYKSGDLRVNQHPHHTAMYTIWVREHNRIARELSKINPHWDDERLFQEARRIVVAEIQHITYKTWVPLVLGDKYSKTNQLTVQTKGYGTFYDKEIDPRVSNSFATVGFRFINSMFQSHIKLYDEKRDLNSSLNLKDYFNKPAIIRKPEVLEQLLRGLSTQTSQNMDASFIKDVTNYLYRSDDYAMGQDIASLDIQRGRDHGLPSYNSFRKFCGLPTTNKFETFLDTMTAANLKKLMRVYEHPDDVDLFAGALLETQADGSLLGPVFRCIVGEQLSRTRHGDRFFYDVKGQIHSFEEGQLKELKKSSLSRIICDNVEGITQMQQDVFRLPSPKNPLFNCNDLFIPKLNLNEWKTTH